MKIKNVFIITLFFINFSTLLLTGIVILKLIKTENKINLLTVQIAENNRNIVLELDDIQKRSNTQFTETKKMKKTYDDLLAEQKKKTVDTIVTDTAVSKMIEEADFLYRNKNFSKSYKLYCDILSFHSEDNDIRFKKMVSLYYMNPMDSSKYAEILRDCELLRHNGKSDPKIYEIEKEIITEKGGTVEE